MRSVLLKDFLYYILIKLNAISNFSSSVKKKNLITYVILMYFLLQMKKKFLK